MENLNEQDQIKDPDQLDLFAGILFTPEQEEMIADFINKQKTHTVLAKIKNDKNETLLLDSDFVKGKDFINTFKTTTTTREVTLGSSWNKSQFRTELTYDTSEGYISLKAKRFNSWEKDKGLFDTTFNIDFDEDKIQCSTIQDQYRYVKPKTLLKKLEEYNERSKQQFEEHKKKNSLKQSVIEKYTKLYPNAVITIKDDWTKYSGSFEVIEVKFESGSYIQFKLDTYKNVEFMYKKHDAEFEKMSAEELLGRFSKQVKKEASN